MIRLGAYRQGADAKTDQAIHYFPALDNFLRQDRNERSDLANGYATLGKILNGGAR
jgi:flagellum-specific ATP synthase